MYPSSVWGPPLWRFLHLAAESHDMSFENMVDMLENLWLPCIVCRAHLKTNLAKVIGQAQSAPDLVWRLHNAVNETTGAPLVPFSQRLAFLQEAEEEDEPSCYPLWLFWLMVGLALVFLVALVLVVVLRVPK